MIIVDTLTGAVGLCPHPNCATQPARITLHMAPPCPHALPITSHLLTRPPPHPTPPGGGWVLCLATPPPHPAAPPPHPTARTYAPHAHFSSTPAATPRNWFHDLVGPDGHSTRYRTPPAGYAHRAGHIAPRLPPHHPTTRFAPPVTCYQPYASLRLLPVWLPHIVTTT